MMAFLPEFLDERISSNGSRAGFAVLDADRLRAFGGIGTGGIPWPDHHEPAATNVASLGKRDGQCESNCDRCVDCVAS